jgi:hypothetical protein
MPSFQGKMLPSIILEKVAKRKILLPIYESKYCDAVDSIKKEAATETLRKDCCRGSIILKILM